MESSVVEVPYATIAREIQAGYVIPFVGAAASIVGVPRGPHRLPDADGLAQRLLEGVLADYPGDASDPLTTVSQYLDEVLLGRQRVYGTLEQIFHPRDKSAPVSPTAQLLAGIPDLRIIITTNYDDYLERALATRRPPRPYVVTTHITNRLHRHYPLLAVGRSDRKCELKYLKDNGFSLHDYEDMVVIYKMHGTFGAGLSYDHDTLILTENDYINRLAISYTQKIPPSAIIRKMKQSHLLFLGYSLTDWNFRVVLHTLREAGIGMRSWAVQHPVSVIEKKFWEKRDVDIYDVDLADFVNRLGTALGVS